LVAFCPAGVMVTSSQTATDRRPFGVHSFGRRCLIDSGGQRAKAQLVVTHASGGYMRSGHISSGIPAGTDAETKALQNRRFALFAQWMQHRFPKRAEGVLIGG
jgi:hypothetical protein